jgi:hypothetical protein
MGSGGIAPTFLTSALDGSQWLASRLYRFTPGKEAPVPIGLEAGWDSLWSRVKYIAPTGNRTQIVQPVARRYTN